MSKRKPKKKSVLSEEYHEANRSYEVVRCVLALQPLSEKVAEVVKTVAGLYFAPPEEGEFSYRRGVDIGWKGACVITPEEMVKLHLLIDEDYLCNRTVEFSSEILRLMDGYFRDLMEANGLSEELEA